MHLPGEDSLLFLFSSENADRSAGHQRVHVGQLSSGVVARPADTMFDQVRYYEYYEQFIVSNSLPHGATESWKDQVPDHQMYVGVLETEKRDYLQNEHAASNCG